MLQTSEVKGLPKDGIVVFHNVRRGGTYYCPVCKEPIGKPVLDSDGIVLPSKPPVCPSCRYPSGSKVKGVLKYSDRTGSTVAEARYLDGTKVIATAHLNPLDRYNRKVGRKEALRKICKLFGVDTTTEEFEQYIDNLLGIVKVIEAAE